MHFTGSRTSRPRATHPSLLVQANFIQGQNCPGPGQPSHCDRSCDSLSQRYSHLPPPCVAVILRAKLTIFWLSACGNGKTKWPPLFSFPEDPEQLMLTTAVNNVFLLDNSLKNVNNLDFKLYQARQTTITHLRTTKLKNFQHFQIK